MKTEHLTITPMRRSDIGECAELSVQAFADYEYFTHLYADREARLAFMRAMIRSEYRTTWYLSSLTVSPDQQGKGFGREMLMDCVVPYVKAHGGTRLCFFTNSESNLHFYQHLGFEVTDYQELDCRGHRMGSWSFAMECR